jgi:hypothetical protein
VGPKVPPTSHVCTNSKASHLQILPKTVYDLDLTVHITEYSKSHVPYLDSSIGRSNNSWPGFTWQQCVLGSDLPVRLHDGRIFWSLLRGTVLWTIWQDRNDLLFQNDPWSIHRIEQTIWDDQCPRACPVSLATHPRLDSTLPES